MIQHIAICGAPTAGKSEVQKILNEEFGVISMDDSRPLREATKVLYGLSEEDVATQAGKSRVITLDGKKTTIRELMGDLGDYLESKDPLHFPKMARRQAEAEFPGQTVSYGSVRKQQAKVFQDPLSIVLEVVRPGVVPINSFDFYDRDLVDVSVLNEFDPTDPEGSHQRLVFEITSKIAPMIHRKLENFPSLLTSMA